MKTKVKKKKKRNEYLIKEGHFLYDLGIREFIAGLHVEESLVDGRNADVRAGIAEDDDFDGVAGLVLERVQRQREVVARYAVDGEGETVGHHFAVLGHVVDDDGGFGCHFRAERHREGRHRLRAQLCARQQHRSLGQDDVVERFHVEVGPHVHHDVLAYLFLSSIQSISSFIQSISSLFQ